MTDNNTDNKVYPTQEEMAFIVCDDIRAEAGNKMGLLGVYGGYEIVFQDDALNNSQESLSIPSLSFYFSFRDGVGNYTSRISVKYGDRSLLDEEMGVIPKQEGRAGVVAFKMAPFTVAGFGTYTVSLVLDGDREYSHPFEIRRANPVA